LRTGKFTVECPCPDAFRSLHVILERLAYKRKYCVEGITNP
jgi:hypothetical protein